MGDTQMPNGWAAYLERRRVEAGLTIKDLAEQAGIGRSTIHDWIANGGSEKISVEKLVAIARVFGDNPINTFMAAADLVREEPDDREIGIIIASPHLDDREKREAIDRIETERARMRAVALERTQQLVELAQRRAS